ncbi:MAG: pyridoxamine 5'-phosphate oxidase [SAR86 cluster bacterium]|uniref:Pyridoxamine 5'-phosphate oxidase n=1 Tax=SAR86 cluster bacterium TaxID=2030880 RepID=A0A2A5CGT3_9GAMM|nr:MAG: pyridoxamine 5'-phosphate oxidase [SAR86 cluster bacterium]
MSEKFPELSASLITFIEKQHVFFVGTARATGTVNLSPKGMGSLKILNSKQLVWLNYTGSGNESAAHILENSRMTIMLCSFERKPLILRLYGKAQALHPRDESWQEYLKLFPETSGARQLFTMDIELVQTSCGFAVPYYEFKEERKALVLWSKQTGDDGIEAYWEEKNQQSIDGFPTDILESSPKD